MLRNRKVWGVLGVLLALVIVGYGQGPVPRMQQIYQQLMDQVSQLMAEAAKELEVPPWPPKEAVVYAARADGIVLAGVPVRDLEKVTLKDLSQGAILGVVYLQLPARLGTAAIPAGFYKMRVLTLPTPAPIGAPNARAQFIDKTGRVVLERPATVRTSEPPAKLQQAKFTAEIGPGEACVDVHWGNIVVKLCLEWQ